jgi:protein-tyrosine phosphatase
LLRKRRSWPSRSIQRALTTITWASRPTIAPSQLRVVAASICRRCARTVQTSDFDSYDLILAMDEQNLRELRRRAPAARHDRIRLMMEFAPSSPERAVPDPYYGGAQGFEQVLDLLVEAAEGLLREMLSRTK